MEKADTINCSLCGKAINYLCFNAEPLANGVVCEKCYKQIIIPAKLLNI